MKLLQLFNGRGSALAAAAAMLTLAAQPCAAAGDPREIGTASTRTGAFAGATIRLDLGSRSAPKPSARLRLGMTHSSENLAPAIRGSVLELGASDRGAPVLFVGGQKVKDLKTRAGLHSSTGTVLLVVGAVAAAAVLVVAASSSAEKECSADDWFC